MKNISYGLYSCLAAIRQRPFHIKEAYLLKARQDKRIQEIQDELLRANVAYRFVTKKELQCISGNGNHQGVAIIYRHLQATSEAGFLEYCANARHSLLLLVLDQIVDPHNLGACLRVAEAAGANAVIGVQRRSAPLTPTVRKVSCGAAERVPFIVTKNLTRYLKELQQLSIWVYGTQLTAKKLLYNADFCRSAAVVIGSEEAGLRRLTASTCDELVRLPMCGEMASLNAAVAAGISLFEAVRQRYTGC